MKHWKLGLGLFAASVSLMATVGVAVGPTASASVQSPATANPSLAIVQSTTSTGFTGPTGSIPASTIHLGFMVKNTGNVTVGEIQVIDGLFGGANCPSLGVVLFPGQSLTCTGTYTTTSTDVTDRSVTSTAEAVGNDYTGADVRATATNLTIPYVDSSTTPLLPTTLKINPFSATDLPDAFDTDCQLANGMSAYRQCYPNAPWTVGGTDSTGPTTCTTSSTKPTSKPTGGIKGALCLGHDTNGDIAIAVPTSNVVIPVVCAMPENSSVYPSHVYACGFQAEQTIGTSTVPIGGLVAVDVKASPTCIPSPVNSGETTCYSEGSLVVPLNAAAQVLTIGTTFGTYGSEGNYVPAGGTQTTSPLLIEVEPTAQIQANVLVNRIVYQPSGVDSSQNFQTTHSAQTETDLSFGQSNANVTGTDTSYGLDASLSVGEDGVTVNMSYSGSWETDSTQTNTNSSNSGNSSTINTTFGESIGTKPWKTGTSPSSPPWMNDEFDLAVNPQFAIWDLSSCQVGVASESGKTTTCGGGAVQPQTAIIPTGIGYEDQISVSDLLPCVEGQRTYPLVGTGFKVTYLSQAECEQIVAQDPFAATGLGIVPTPAGEFPGEAVNPAVVLGGTSATPFGAQNVNPGLSKGFTENQSQTNANFYSTSQSLESDITSIAKNSVSVGASVDVDIPDIATVNASLSFTYGETSTTGQMLTENYNSNQTDTTTQTFNTSATLAGRQSAVSVTPYLDPRYDTFMFQSGLNPTNTVPAISKIAPLAPTLETPLTKGEHLAAGTVLTMKSSFGPDLSAGAKLALPSGQVLVASKGTTPGAKSVAVQAATITTAVPAGSTIAVVDYEVVYGTGMLNGPDSVSFCTNATAIPSCTPGTHISQGAAGTAMFATTSVPPGNEVAVVVQSQSGYGNYGATIPASNGLPYFVPYGPPPTFTSVKFTGSSAAPTVTITGSGFGLQTWLGPASTPCGGTDTTGKDYDFPSMAFFDSTVGWSAGQGPVISCNYLGVHITSYSPTKVVFTFGSPYLDYGGLNPGDKYYLIFLGGEAIGTVAYT